MSDSQFLRTLTVLPVRDIAEATDWYEQNLGMSTIYLHEGQEPGEVTNYAVLERDGLHVHLILDEHFPDAEAWVTSGNGYLYLKVRDVDAMYAEVQQRGASIARELRTENWGARGFNLRDPSGNSVHVEEER